MVQEPTRRESMKNPTPQYNNGDRIHILRGGVDGIIQWRWYDEFRNCWMYRVYRAGGD